MGRGFDAPLVGVNVLLKGERTGGDTSADGTFIIPGIAPDAYTLQARALGFATAQRTITVRAGRTTRVTARLGVKTRF